MRDVVQPAYDDATLSPRTAEPAAPRMAWIALGLHNVPFPVA